jgi:hypothetical protein
MTNIGALRIYTSLRTLGEPPRRAWRAAWRLHRQCCAYDFWSR